MRNTNRWGEMSIRSETYAKDLMSYFQYCDGVSARRRRSPGLKGVAE
ncbi:hypothetical protein WKK05_13520 [Nostoc sp. UHCC 0302]